MVTIGSNEKQTRHSENELEASKITVDTRSAVPPPGQASGSRGASC